LSGNEAYGSFSQPARTFLTPALVKVREKR
jgi:hypothetical protein